MLAISKSSSFDESSVNILPCRIDHNGPAKVTKRFWQPRTEADSTKTAHFRGRRLRGKTIKVPEKYQGLVLKATDKTIIEPVQPAEDDDEEEPELPEPVKVVDEVSTFDEMIVWGHDQVPAADDSFVKGIEEWIAFAEAIHGQ